LARSRVKLGKYVEALEDYQKIIHDELPPNASDAFVDAQRSAVSEGKALEGKLAWLTVTAAGQPDDLTVTLDGASLPSAAIGARRPMNPGAHELRATADGHAPFESAFTLSEGMARSIRIVLEPRTEKEAQEQEQAQGPWLTVGIVAMSVGAAGLIAGAITGGIAVGQESELEDTCIDGRCDAEQYGTLDSYRAMSTVSTVCFIAGGVLAAGGLTLVIVSLTGDDEQTAALSFGPTSLSFSAAW
jgi:hypothetical protein